MAKKGSGRPRKRASARAKDLKARKSPRGGAVAAGALGYSVHIPMGLPAPPTPTPPKK
jgi:hypothetical protein